MQFINHKCHHRVCDLCHHPDAVPLPQTACEILIGPGKFKGFSFNLENFSHVSTDHPSHVDLKEVLLEWYHVLKGSDCSERRREPSDFCGQNETGWVADNSRDGDSFQEVFTR